VAVAVVATVTVTATAAGRVNGKANNFVFLNI
jgi:hypothetical protein